MPTRRSKISSREEENEPMEICATVVAHDAVPRIVERTTRSKSTPVKSPAVSKRKETPKRAIISDDEEMSSADELSDASVDHEDNDAYTFHQRFFEGTKRSKTSNNTLTVDKTELQRKMEEISEKASKSYNSFESYFNYWLLLMSENYNLLFHGLGSKMNTMKQFRTKLENDGYDTVFVNAFYEGSTDKQLFDAILTDFADIKPPGQVEAALDSLIEFYTEESSPVLFIFINNIESSGIARSLHLLLKLCSLEKVHLIGTIDKVYGPFVFDQSQLGNFKFLSFEITSFSPFSLETKVTQNLLSKHHGKIGLSSLQHVFDSLTDNGKGVLKLIIKEQIEQIKQRKDGPNFKELYRLCRKNFLVNSETALKAQLVELRDHHLITESVQQIRIQLQQQQLADFVKANS